MFGDSEIGANRSEWRRFTLGGEQGCRRSECTVALAGLISPAGTTSLFQNLATPGSSVSTLLPPLKAILDVSG
jgi:hypothetical protein